MRAVLLSAAAPLFLFCILILHSYFAFLFCILILRGNRAICARSGEVFKARSQHQHYRIALLQPSRQSVPIVGLRWPRPPIGPVPRARCFDSARARQVKDGRQGEHATCELIGSVMMGGRRGLASSIDAGDFSAAFKLHYSLKLIIGIGLPRGCGTPARQGSGAN
jgi:hypothetical protein